MERNCRRSHLARGRAQISRNLLLGTSRSFCVHSRLYQRWYPVVCPYGAMFFGASMLVLRSYPVIATLAGIPGPQRLVDVGVLLFTNVIGAIVCYSLERANRTNFLEAQPPVYRAGNRHSRYFDRESLLAPLLQATGGPL